ncbi:YqcI/YcgG family protein [Waterburya agarophytonicola]|nr:YqcI/YcgG family protein [Waterburya agarophytonicola]
MTSRLWGSPPYDEAKSFEENMEQIMEDMCNFLDVAREQRLDGYVLELPGSGFGENLGTLAYSLHRILYCLSEHDPVGEHCLNQPVEDLAWSFAFGGDKIFVNTFAPFYPEGHSRYGFGSSSTWIMFQPRHSFGRVAKIGETALPPHIRLRIREDHASHNRAYDPKLSAIPYEAYRCIRPLCLGDSEVRWWETTL